MVDFHLNQVISFWEITSIGEDKAFKLYACCLPIKLSIQKKYIFSEEIISLLPLQEYMASMKNVNRLLNSGKNRYNMKLWKSFIDCFNCMPVAALIEDKILCMHGGLSPDLTSVNQIN